ncbi:methionine--tRNA ligase [Pacificimonas flava]|uniref:Methionine--tRNA ligase n=2 Tax=Pacificimonas TaxID=1960290 RepID=A0A219B8L7_9SPHN|nr:MULTISPECIES: methionine--tRNA ligase [Pacificimonas]MBZ6378570.1 methionine--tRNA ligase [Pacificimonas aurantium]OWV34149.1 methionine--tRNA ligase [Pacificimonas flava]
MTERYYITTAINYPNGRPHMGHAYEAIATDFIARFRRLEGREVFFLTGTDEHGLKIAQAARAAGQSPREYVSEMVHHFKEMDEVLNISYDRFIRTTEPDHYACVQDLWTRMEASGDIYLGKYEGWYSVRDEAYYDEKELIAGDDGEKLSPEGTPVEWTVEESYFFRLSAYQEKLLALYEAQPDFIQPAHRLNEMKSFVSGGLRDLSISRTSFDWGVPVPGTTDHVMYVWLDALSNYLSGVGYPDESYRDWWPCDVHVIGKDVVRFHSVYWPAFLMSAGIELPKAVFGHGFVLWDGKKMSKSSGNVVEPLGLAARYGTDQLRYFLLREVPFGHDGAYSEDAIVTRANADLANDLGNLAQRCLSMIAKNCEGRVPEPSTPTPADKALDMALSDILSEMQDHMGRLQIHSALETLWRQVGETNAYFAGREPWALKKTDPEAMGSVLYRTADAVRQLAILAQPAVPEGAAKLLDLLAVPENERSFDALGNKLRPGTELPAPKGVFPRLERQTEETAS